MANVAKAGAAAVTKKAKSLVSRMDAEATALLAAKDEANVVLSLETRLAIFDKVARWIQIRNRIGDVEEQTGLLHAYRRSIESGQSAVAEREAARVKAINYESSKGYGVGRPREYSGRNQRAVAKHSTADNGGDALEELKSRLPRSDDAAADVDRGGGSGEDVAIIGSNRLVHPHRASDLDADLDEPRDDSDF